MWSYCRSAMRPTVPKAAALLAIAMAEDDEPVSRSCTTSSAAPNRVAQSPAMRSTASVAAPPSLTAIRLFISSPFSPGFSVPVRHVAHGERDPRDRDQDVAVADDAHLPDVVALGDVDRTRDAEDRAVGDDAQMAGIDVERGAFVARRIDAARRGPIGDRLGQRQGGAAMEVAGRRPRAVVDRHARLQPVGPGLDRRDAEMRDEAPLPPLEREA